MKKIQRLLIATLALLLMNSSHALEIIDVRADHWAGQSIIHAIQNGYIYVIDGNKFKPEGTMTRSEFVSALLKVIRRQNEPVVQATSFKDITEITPNKKSITLSEQIRMAFGYPDKTFKPEVGLKMGTIFPELVSPYSPCQDMREMEYIAATNKIKEGCNKCQ